MTARVRRPTSRRFRVSDFPVHVALVLASIVWLIPIAGLVVSSFRPGAAVRTTGWWTSAPDEYTFENYRQVLDRNGLLRSLLNSFAIAVPATVITVCMASLAAFGLARFRFRGRAVVLVALVAFLVVPTQITLVPLLRLSSTLGLAGSFPAVWFVHVGFALPFAIYLLHNFFAELPRELFEAAAVDGATEAHIFLRIVLPLSRSAIASLAILEFVWNWNDLLVALIFLGGSPDVAPLTVTVSNMVASRGEGWQLLTSAAVCSVVVPMAVFLSAQRYFVRGMLAGASKG